MTYSETDGGQFARIQSYLEMGRYPLAEPLIRKAIGDQPNEPLLYYWLSLCLYMANRSDEAREPLETALGLGIDPAIGHLLMGNIYEEQSDLVQAETHFLQALRLNPESAPALSGYAHVLLRGGHKKKGLAVLEEALRLDPSDARALATQSLVLLSYGTRKEQLAHLAATLQTADTEALALLQVALHELMHNRLGPARELLRQIYLITPENKELLDVLDELSLRTSVLYLPVRLMEKIGGTAGLWLIAAAAGIASKYLLPEVAGTVVTLVILVFVLSTWVGPFVHLAVGRKQRSRRTPDKQTGRKEGCGNGKN